jgi:hypothetical protein
MSNLAKKRRRECVFLCRNSDCPKPGGFTSQKGLNIHYGMSPHCALHAATPPTRMQRNVVDSPSLSLLQPCDFDDDNSIPTVAHPVANQITNTNTTTSTTVGASTTMHPASNQHANQYGIKYTTEQFTETKLLKILNDAAAPHFLYQDILTWAKEARRNDYSFSPQRLERTAQVKYLEKWLHLESCRPETVRLTLPGPSMQTISVTRFNFTNQLHALVSNPALCGNLDSLDVNVDDPFAKYVSPSGRLSAVNSGSIYDLALAYKNRCKHPGGH